MKIVNGGDHPLSNADVLDWIQRKRAQHRREDADDTARGIPPASRPNLFMTALTRHERELRSTKYPYTRNPSVYVGEKRIKAFKNFALELENVLQDHLEEQWRERLRDMTKDQIDHDYAPLQDMKCLTDPELLSIFNHAPTSVEVLQPMIESVDDRFTADEQQIIIDMIVRRLRCDEQHKTDNAPAALNTSRSVVTDNR